MTFGGKKDDAAFQVVALEDGYALVCRTDSGKDDEKIKLIRVDPNGKNIWERSYRGSSAASLQSTEDGGFIIAGRVDSKETGRDALIIKTNSMGIMQWSIAVGGGSDDIGTFAIQRRDGSYMMAGITSSFGQGREDAWLVKIRAEPSSDESETPLPNRTISFPTRKNF